MIGSEMNQSTKDIVAYRIYPDEDISATDLSEELAECREKGLEYEHGLWCHVNEDGYLDTGEHGQYLYVWGRLGIVKGGDATWADVPSIEQGLDWYLNDPEEWERRG